MRYKRYSLFINAALLLLAIPSVYGKVTTGTAFSISDGRYYVTNAHVVNRAVTICLRSFTGELFTAKIKNLDESDDLAILHSELVAPPMLLAPYGHLKKGLKVITIGFPDPGDMGLESKVTEGIINSLSGYKGDLKTIQISTPIQPGNSGGPLISEYGNVVGVVAAKLDKLYDTHTGLNADSVGYAINVARLQGLIEITRDMPVITRTQVSKTRISTVDLVSISERSVIMVLNYSEKVTCKGNIPEFPQFALAEPSQGRKEPVSPPKRQPKAERKDAEIKKKQDALKRERKASEKKKREDASRFEEEKKHRADEERREAKAKLEEQKQQIKVFNDALDQLNPLWKIVYQQPGFATWSKMDKFDLDKIFTSYKNSMVAISLFRKYLEFVGSVYDLSLNASPSNEQLQLGGIELNYKFGGTIEKANADFGFFVVRTVLDVKKYHKVWFYSSFSKAWLSLPISKKGKGWVSVNIPKHMGTPVLSTKVYFE